MLNIINSKYITNAIFIADKTKQNKNFILFCSVCNKYCILMYFEFIMFNIFSNYYCWITKHWNKYFFPFFLFLVRSAYLDLLDANYELHIRNELLSEKLSDVQSALVSLDRKYRKFKAKHVSCKKVIILYRWFIILFFLCLFAVFCCQWHVGCSIEVKLDCIRHLDELVEFVQNNYKEE